MRLKFISFFIFLSHLAFSQETFPINGVENNFHPIYAFTNAHIIVSPEKEIQRGTLLIQNNKILKVDSILDIPTGSIVRDLNGKYIYPSFIDLYSNYGLEKPKKESYPYRPQYETNKKQLHHFETYSHFPLF